MILIKEEAAALSLFRQNGNGGSFVEVGVLAEGGEERGGEVYA